MYVWRESDYECWKHVTWVFWVFVGETPAEPLTIDDHWWTNSSDCSNVGNRIPRPESRTCSLGPGCRRLKTWTRSRMKGRARKRHRDQTPDTSLKCVFVHSVSSPKTKFFTLLDVWCIFLWLELWTVGFSFVKHYHARWPFVIVATVGNGIPRPKSWTCSLSRRRRKTRTRSRTKKRSRKRHRISQISMFSLFSFTMCRHQRPKSLFDVWCIFCDSNCELLGFRLWSTTMHVDLLWL